LYNQSVTPTFHPGTPTILMLITEPPFPRYDRPKLHSEAQIGFGVIACLWGSREPGNTEVTASL
jgi:hypothetical protein